MNLPDYNLFFESEIQGSVILYLQGKVHSRLLQEKIGGASKGGPLQVDFDTSKKRVTCTFSMCFVKESVEIDLDIVSTWAEKV